MADYSELYKKVKTFYFKLKKLPCSELGEDIIFDRHGFRHMLNKGYSKRSIPDQIRRFKLFLQIEKILPTVNLDKSNREGFCRLVGTNNNKRVRIVLVPIKSGKKRFVSIM